MPSASSTPCQRLPRIAAGTVDQARGQTLRIVEQNLQHMFGRELLMALAQREGLRRLDESASAVGVFLDIHSIAPSGPLEAPGRRTSDEHPPGQDVRSNLPGRKGGLALIFVNAFKAAGGSLR